MSWKKVTGVIAIMTVAILIILHFWITYHAEYLLKKLITVQSNGALLFDADRAQVDYLNGRVEFNNSSLNSISKNNEAINTYHIECKKLVLQLKDILPLITGRHVAIDSVIIQSPHVVLIKKEQQTQQRVNLAAEWGTIYNGLIKTVNLFYVSKLHITNASFRMEEALNPGNQPLELSGINLLVNQLYAGKENTGNPAITVKEIELTLGREKIIFPGGQKEIGFKQFSINTATGLVMLDSCSVISRSVEDGAEINIFTDSLSIQHMDFPHLYQTGNIKAAKIQLSKPLVQISLHPKVNNTTIEKKSLRELIESFNSNLFLDELLVNNARTNIVAAVEGKTNRFVVNDVNFYVRGLKAGSGTTNKSLLSYDSIDLSVKNHRGAAADSAFIFENGLFHFTNDQVYIHDVKLYPNSRHNSSGIKNISVKKVQVDGLSVKDLLFYSAFSANTIRVYEPDVSMVKRTSVSSKKTEGNLPADLGKLVKLKNLFLINGKLNYTDNNGTAIRINQLNSNTKIPGIFNSRSAHHLVAKMQQFGFGDAVIQLPTGIIHLNQAALAPGSEAFTIKKVFLDLKAPAVKAELENVQAGITLPDKMAQTLQIKNIGWDKGSIQVTITGKQQEKKSEAKPISLYAEKIHIENTRLEYSNRKQMVQSFVKNATVNDLKMTPGQKPIFKEISLLAQETSFKDSLLNLSVQAITVPANNQVNFSGIQFYQADSNLALNLTVPSFQLEADIKQLAAEDFNFNKVILDQPAFSLILKNNHSKIKQSNNAIKMPLLHVKDFEIKNATGTIVLANDKQTPDLDIKNLSVSAADVSVVSDSVSILQNNVTADNIIFSKANERLFDGGVGIAGRDFLLHDSNWSYHCDEISVRYASLNLLNKDSASTKLQVSKLALKKLMLNAGNSKNIQALLSDNRTAGIDINHLAVQLPKENITINRITSDEINKEIQFDSVKVNPSLNREAFIEQSPWETDDIRITAAGLSLKNWRIDSWLKDSTISFAGIAADQPLIDVYRDKNKPDLQGINKPLPTSSLQAAPLRFAVDSITVNKGHVIYHEKSEQTQLTGKVEFTSLKAKISNIKNVGLTGTDSLRLSASAKFMDKALVKVRIDESYLDSLSGFLFAAYLSPTPLDILNDITQPTASLQIQSGFVDTMYMHAIAREYISLGVMHMPYRDLSVKFLNKGVEDDKDLLSGLVTFAANTFVIKHNNKKRKGVIYFPRLREEGIFNYLAKMFLSGAASSVGAKSNKAYLRQYKRALKKKQLPPIRAMEE